MDFRLYRASLSFPTLFCPVCLFIHWWQRPPSRLGPLFGAVSIHTPKLILHWSASCPSPQRNKVNDISDMSASKLLADRRNRVKWAMSEELELPEKAFWCWNESGSENIAVPSAFAQAAERGAGLVWHFLQSQTVRKLLGMWFFFGSVLVHRGSDRTSDMATTSLTSNIPDLSVTLGPTPACSHWGCTEEHKYGQ